MNNVLIQNNGVPTPGGVDLVPIHGDRGEATQPEPVNCAEVSRVPNVKGGVEHVRLLELLQLALGGAQLGVQASILVLGLQQLVLVPAVLTPVVLLLVEQYRYMVSVARIRKGIVFTKLQNNTDPDPGVKISVPDPLVRGLDPDPDPDSSIIKQK
jgi:hypothetical protein